MESRTKTHEFSVSLFFFAFVILAALKLLGVIALSWIWVTAPLWAPWVVTYIFVALCFFVAMLGQRASLKKFSSQNK